jgi:hypothetical protein
MDNELSNIEINNILKNYKRFKGCYQKDELPSLEPYSYYIVNLQSSNDGQGTHWCCLYCIKSNLIFWFDAYGFPPPEPICNNYNYYYNHVDLQGYNDTTCGYYCIALIKYTYSFSDFKKGVEGFIKLFKKDTSKNNMILEQLLSKYMDLHLKVVFE